MKYDYLIKPKYIVKREADYSLLKKIKNFKFINKCADGNGNVCSELQVNIKSKKPKFVGYMSFNHPEYKNYIGFYQAIPSCLLLYRLACLFEGQAKFGGQEGYKVTWEFSLKHKPTGEIITFGYWKGGALFWTQHSSYTELDKSLQKDLLDLLSVLLNKNCPHPYDGLVAGSVA